jgi:cell division protein FtsI/penicillin-binding protein 2
VIMDPKTWKVITMANYPSYNSNNYWDVYEIEKVRYSKYPNPMIDLLWYPVFVEDTENWDKHFYDNK